LGACEMRQSVCSRTVGAAGFVSVTGIVA
jgi:hypothetical protein